MSIIEINNLVKYYGKNRAIDNISLKVEKGDIYGFVGPNGAGKSTLIKLLLNFIFKTEGSGSIFGYDIEVDSVKIKEKTAYVPSDVRFYREYTSEEICKLTMKIHKKLDIEYMDYIFRELDIEKDKKFMELSLGNKKKIAIASALVSRPELIVLDEPTNGLDPLVQKNLFKLLKEIVNDGGTVFVSSHNLKEIEDHCNKVGFIKKGKIIKEIELNNNIKRKKVVNIIGECNEDSFSSLKNILIEDNAEGCRFIYDGDINELLKILHSMDLKDININDLSLEEEFLGYYKRGEEDDI